MAEQGFSSVAHHKTTLEVNGFGGTNTDSTPEEHQRQIRHRNTPAYVHHNFFGSNSVRALWKLNDSTQIVLQHAGNPYGLDLQIAAMPRDALLLTPDEVHTIRPTDLSEIAQQKWWEVQNAYLLATTMVLPQPDNVGKLRLLQRKPTHATHTFIAENNQNLSWIDANRTSRTIFIPHVHGPVIQQSWLKENPWEIDHIDRQNQQLRDLMVSPYGIGFLRDIRQNMLDHAPNEAIRQRIEKDLVFSPQLGDKPLGPLNPIGYSVDFLGITNKNLLAPETTDFIAYAMQLHDAAYKDAMITLQQSLKDAPIDSRPIAPDDFTIQQPAFSRYLHLMPLYAKGKVRQYHMTISPTINSHGGSMEIGGIQLIRGPEHPLPLPKRQRDRYEFLATRAVLRLTKQDRRYEKQRINNNPMLWRRNKRYFNEGDHP